MNSGDLQLMNRDQSDGYNLAVGEPRFLQDGWDTVPMSLPVKEADLGYPNAEGDRALLDELGWIYPGKFIVVTHGAKGALMAAYYALKMEADFEPWAVRSLNKFYWPTHPTLAALQGMRFEVVDEDSFHDYDALHLLTGPNNPDGSFLTAERQVDVWDAAYASKLYGWDGVVPFNRISTWSLAKMMGLSGLRVGWLVTGEKALYEAARHYMEKTSSGVSRLSQKLAAGLLRSLRVYPEARALYIQQGQLKLQQNADRLMDSLSTMFVSAQGANQGRGMYIWAQLLDPDKFHEASRLSGVHVLNGNTCGASAEFVRISCGQTEAVNDEAAKQLRAAYDTL
jgi:aspartate/methionine/tyrosine aminotransferase